MKFYIEFNPSRYYDGKTAYELKWDRGYDSGGGGRNSYWDSAGFFTDEEAARKAAKVIKEKTVTIQFEV